MKKEIGKWLMDIAKYITTAVLLSAVFRDMESPWVVIGGISAAMGTLAWGLYLIRDNETSHKPHKNVNNMGAIAVYIFVLLVANVAGLYYYFDDKRKEKEEQD